MKKKDLEDKKILIVDENPNILNFLEKEILKTGLNYQFDKADTFSLAVDSLFSRRYDLVVLDFPGIRGPYLLNLAFLREMPVVLLVTNNFFPFEAPYLHGKGIRGFLPKEKITEIIPVLENLFSS
jgi:DNA-binding NtrC family response regulator